MKIKKPFISAVVLSLTVGSVFAQKAKVVSAYNYNKSYERDKECSELKKGIEAIELASKDVKTSLYAKTWYYGGNLWFNAALTQDKECATQFPNSMTKAYTYYANALKLNIEDPAAKSLDLEKEEDKLKLLGYLSNKTTSYEDASYYRDIRGNKFPYLANAFVNRGVEEFQAGNYEQAKEYSLKSVEVNQFLGKVDSLGVYNAALSAERLKQDEDAVKFYTVLTQINYGGPNIYMYIANIHDRNKDTTKKMEAINSGLEKYPEDENLIREQLTYLLVTGKTEEAMASFDKAIEKDPENSTLYYNRGLILDQMGKYDEAAIDYKKAMDLDPKFFDAAYNLGAMYYNMGVEWNNKASSYGLNETSKYKEATSKANELFAKAQPALEKAHEINAEDQSTMASLVKIYAIVGANDKYVEMKAKLQGK